MMSTAEEVLERMHMTNSRRTTYIACENMDFTWSIDEVLRVGEMWKQGKSVDEMAKELDRDPDELAILIIDRVKIGRMHPRKGGVFGKMTGEALQGGAVNE